MACLESAPSGPSSTLHAVMTISLLRRHLARPRTAAALALAGLQGLMLPLAQGTPAQARPMAWGAPPAPYSVPVYDYPYRSDSRLVQQPYGQPQPYPQPLPPQQPPLLTAEQQAQRCNVGRLVGGLVGGGLGFAVSRGDGRAWATPLGALLGSQVGCNTAQGNAPVPW